MNSRQSFSFCRHLKAQQPAADRRSRNRATLSPCKDFSRVDFLENGTTGGKNHRQNGTKRNRKSEPNRTGKPPSSEPGAKPKQRPGSAPFYIQAENTGSGENISDFFRILHAGGGGRVNLCGSRSGRPPQSAAQIFANFKRES